MIFYFYFNPQHTHHSWLTHSGNKGPRRDAPRSFVAVIERFFVSLIRGSLSKVDALAMLNAWCFMQCESQGSQTGFSLSSPSSCSYRASPPCAVAIVIPSMGLMTFPLLKHESDIQITLEGTQKKLWFYLTPVTSLTDNQWYLSQRQGQQIPCGGADPSQQAVDLVIHHCFTSSQHTFHLSWGLIVEMGPKNQLLIS